MLFQPCNILESSTTTKDNTFWICQKKFSMDTEEPWQRERLGLTQPVYTGLLRTGLREENGDNRDETEGLEWINSEFSNISGALDNQWGEGVGGQKSMCRAVCIVSNFEN